MFNSQFVLNDMFFGSRLPEHNISRVSCLDKSVHINPFG